MKSIDDNPHKDDGIGWPYPRPSVTVDLVVFTVIDTDLKVLLIQRRDPPFQHDWALPGGFVRVGEPPAQTGESVTAAAHRELEEETGLKQGTVYLEQLQTFGKPNRDPRMRVISVAWYALVRPDLAPFVSAGSDAEAAQWWSVSKLPMLAFDHDEMVSMAIERVRSKLDRSDIAFELVPPSFTIGDLRGVFETIHGHQHDRGNFRRRFHRMLEDGVIISQPGKRQTRSKPAQVYCFNRGS